GITGRAAGERDGSRQCGTASRREPGRDLEEEYGGQDDAQPSCHASIQYVPCRLHVTSSTCERIPLAGMTRRMNSCPNPGPRPLSSESWHTSAAGCRLEIPSR